jgi:hypothetical protein
VAAKGVITINRAPVLTLWAAVVAQRLGFDEEEALTLGRAVAGLNAYSKAVSLGLYKPAEPGAKKKRDEIDHGDELRIDLLHRAVPAVHTADGIRALSKGKPDDPDSVRRYLAAKFKDDLEDATTAMAALAASVPKGELADRAYALYEQFRPSIPAGARGWGAKGALDLGVVRGLAKRGSKAGR